MVPVDLIILKRKDMPIKRNPRKTAKPAPKRVEHEDIERLAFIRKQNLQRHAGQEARNLLRDRIRRNQANENFRMERDRLIAATARGPLSGAAEARLKHLKDLIARGSLSEATQRRLQEVKEVLV